MVDLNRLAETAPASAEKREKNGGGLGTETCRMLKHCATEVVEAVGAAAYY